MDLQIKLATENRCELFLLAGTLHTQVMFLTKVISEEWICRVVILFPVALAEVAPKVNLAQVCMESVVVKVTLITELAEWVALVAGIIWVSVSPMPSQLLPAILPQLEREQFEVLTADVAVEEAVSLACMVSQEGKAAKGWLITALGASEGLQGLVPVIELGAPEKVAILPVHFGPVRRQGERLYRV